MYGNSGVRRININIFRLARSKLAPRDLQVVLVDMAAAVVHAVVNVKLICSVYILENVTCREGTFPCGSGECISSSKQCDFNDDCFDGSDELNCGRFFVLPILTPILRLQKSVVF